MIKWAPYSFVRIVLFFIAGIVAAIYWPDVISPQLGLLLLIGLGLIYGISYFVFRSQSRSVYNLGWIGLPAIFVGGYSHVIFQTDSRMPDHLLTETKAVQYYVAQISSAPQEKERSWKAEANISQIYTGTWNAKKAKIVLYFSKDVYTKPFSYGDIVLVRGIPQTLNEPANPGEFDYKKFLSYRNIYHQHFVRDDDVRRIGYTEPNPVMAIAIRARTWADSTLSEHVTGEREQAIASALVLGVTDGLDNELLNAYAATGAMHVLAVSGLHISIIYMLLLALLKPVKKLRNGEWILATISLVVLWGYAFVTGLSPSVLRAVTMFSFMALARPMNQSTNIYNTLAASAFFILLSDPLLIMSVGFQLSYLAVIGIVYLQPGMYDLWQPKFRLWDEIWKISSVSIAAQISTFALGLLYFHQFPNYFLLSNLLVIPGSFLVLIAGIGVLVFSLIGMVASWLGFVLTWLIKLLNIVVFTVEAFPFSLVENISITIAQCWILMILMIFMTLLFQRKRFSYLVMTFATAIFFCILQWGRYVDTVDSRKITVYNIAGHTALDLFDRGQSFFYADSSLQSDQDKIRFHIRPNRLQSGVGKIFTDREFAVRKIQGGKIISWQRKIIVHVTGKNFSVSSIRGADFIIIGNNAVSDLTVFPSNSTLILDSSNSYYYCRNMKAIAIQKNKALHSVRLDGAFEQPVL